MKKKESKKKKVNQVGEFKAWNPWLDRVYITAR